uniref:Uncharacterized protein n=1 Tax=Amphilophus citrinellus TaxID=61819 RepID=A0A3Q0SEP0_AMPCI
MWTRGLKVSCRYSSVDVLQVLLCDQAAAVTLKRTTQTARTSPRLDFMFLQLVDLHLMTQTHLRVTPGRLRQVQLTAVCQHCWLCEGMQVSA